MGRPGAGTGGRSGGGSSSGHRSSSMSSSGHRVGSSRPSTPRMSSSRPTGNSGFGGTPKGNTRTNINLGPSGPRINTSFDIPLGGSKRRDDVHVHVHTTPPPPPPRRTIIHEEPVYRERTVIREEPVYRERTVVREEPVVVRERTVVKERTVRSGFNVWVIFAILVAIAVIVSLVSSVGDGSPSSTVVRTAIDNPQAWVNDCVWNETGWIENTGYVSKQLRKFYDKTGVQPYIMLRNYDPELTTDKEKEQWARDLFESEGLADNAFLYVYFDEGTDDIGYMAQVAGNRATAIFDQEATNIFWSKIDYYWTSDLSMDDVVVEAFNDTATSIMHVSTTTADIVLRLVVFVFILLVIFAAISFILRKSKLDAEKAKADAEILSKPLKPSGADDDPLVEKYGSK